MKRSLLLASFVIGLAACQPQAPNGEPAPPPADAPATALPVQPANIDISKPITAHGTEPFWALTIDGKAFKLSRPDHPDLVVEAPAPRSRRAAPSGSPRLRRGGR